MNPKPAKALDRDGAPRGDAELREALMRCHGVAATNLIWRSASDQPWHQPTAAEKPRRH